MTDKRKTVARSIQSMTGFAHRLNDDEPAISIELRGVNARFLDIIIRAPDELRSVEPALRELLRQRIGRGKVECRVNLREPAAGGAAEPDPAALAGLAATLQQLRAAIPGLAAPSASDLLRLPALFSRPPDLESLQARTLALATEALGDFIASRESEGRRLASLIAARLDEIGAIAQSLQVRVPEITTMFEDRLRERIGAALAQAPGAAGLDATEVAARVSQEVAVFGLRADVAEELDRLGAHVAQCRELLGARLEPVGKRLDFLMQELNREANTVGAKASAIDLSRSAVDLKVLIEQIREQVQNLE